MGKASCTVVVPTHSAYLDVCRLLLDFINKYWKQCPYEIVVSYFGVEQQVDFCKAIYNGSENTLTNCVKSAAEAFDSEYYISLLGDAYITSNWNQQILEEILKFMKDNKIDYCSLKPTKEYAKKKNAGERARYIHAKDRYGFSFISFICSKKFIETEFGEQTSDWDFEKKYLEIANDETADFYYTNAISVDRNYFDIHPGIVKGKWDRLVLRQLKRNSPEFDYGTRGKLSMAATTYVVMAELLEKSLPPKCRRQLKSLYKKITKVDTTDL